MTDRQKSIFSYFPTAKKSKKDADNSNAQPELMPHEKPASSVTQADSSRCEMESSHTSIPSTSKAAQLQQVFDSIKVSNDVGDYIGQRIDDYTKKSLLEDPWVPPENYAFPFSTRMVSGREINNYITHKHLNAYKEWLVLSNVKKGLFCKYCPWFTPLDGGKISWGALVTKPLTNFKNLVGTRSDLELHAQNIYHKNAMAAEKDFLRNLNNLQNEVISLLDSNYLRAKQENREKLTRIAKAIIFLGRQNIALRGHRDNGPLLLDQTCKENEGNFRAVLRLMVDSGDKLLESHLNSTSSRATYISKDTQNQLIECSRAEILQTILMRVTRAEYYSLVFDESPDLSGKAQVSIVLRYVDFSDGGPSIREDFCTFLDAFAELSKNTIADTDDSEVEDENSWSTTATEVERELSLTGVGLGQMVLKEMKKMGLNIKLCASIGTDACAVMLSDCGAVNEIRKEAENAVVSPCFSHKLNSSISKSIKVRVIEMVCSTIREVDKFFKKSYPKRATALYNLLGEQLVQLCETRWVQRHDAVIQFAAKMPLIVDALTKISEWRNRETAGKATVLIAAVCKFEFIVGLFCLCDVLSLTHSLSVILQKEDIDLAKASKMIDMLLVSFQNRRKTADQTFKVIYSDAKKLAEELDVSEGKPRTSGRQTGRDNYNMSTCEDYYRVSVYIPLLDSISEDLKTRFSKEVLDGFQLCFLLPEKVCTLKANEIENLISCLITRFNGLLNYDNVVQRLRLKGELNQWQIHWQLQQKLKTNKLPTSAWETLKQCDVDIYPLIHVFLRIFCTFPVTNASSERSFSTLRRLKTWLRTTMLQERLIGLALLHTHLDIEVTPENVIDRFAKIGPHRLVL